MASLRARQRSLIHKIMIVIYTNRSEARSCVTEDYLWVTFALIRPEFNQQMYIKWKLFPFTAKVSCSQIHGQQFTHFLSVIQIQIIPKLKVGILVVFCLDCLWISRNMNHHHRLKMQNSRINLRLYVTLNWLDVASSLSRCHLYYIYYMLSSYAMVGNCCYSMMLCWPNFDSLSLRRLVFWGNRFLPVYWTCLT